MEHDYKKICKEMIKMIEERETTEVRKCRVCGCTDEDCRQCIKKTGHPCHWVERDLCSACVQENQFLHQVMSAVPIGMTILIPADKVRDIQEQIKYMGIPESVQGWIMKAIQKEIDRNDERIGEVIKAGKPGVAA